MSVRIVLTGAAGVGKTTLALLIRRLLEDAGLVVQYDNPDAGPGASRSFLSVTDLAARLAGRVSEPVLLEETTVPHETAFLQRGRQEALVLGQIGSTATLCCPFCKSDALDFNLTDAPCLEAEGSRGEELKIPLRCDKGHEFELVVHNHGDDKRLHVLVAADDG